MSARTTSRLLIGVTVALVGTIIVGFYFYSTNSSRIDRITKIVQSPCQQDASSRECIHIQEQVARKEPRRVICILFERAGYPCRRQGLSSLLTASHVHRCHRHGRCYCRKHHTCHRHHHRCAINILGIRVCTSKASHALAPSV